MRMRASFRQFGDIMCAAFGLRRTGTPLKSGRCFAAAATPLVLESAGGAQPAP